MKLVGHEQRLVKNRRGHNAIFQYVNLSRFRRPGVAGVAGYRG